MISGIILAAGESKRMGERNKLLLPFLGKTIVENIVDVVFSSDVNEAIVVLGYEAERVRTILSDRLLQYAINYHYQKGMTRSIQCPKKVLEVEVESDHFVQDIETWHDDRNIIRLQEMIR